MENKATTKRYNRNRIGLGLTPYQDAAHAIGKVSKGMSLFGFTKGQFSLLDIIEHITEQIRDCEVQAITWNIGIADCEQIGTMLDMGYISSFQLITDYAVIKMKAENLAAYIDLLGEENVFLTKIHAKVVLLKSKDYHVVIRSSMNLNKNGKCEQFDIDENAELYDFVKAAIDDLKSPIKVDKRTGSTGASAIKAREQYAIAWGDNVTSINDGDGFLA
jgi:hypothetical protein